MIKARKIYKLVPRKVSFSKLKIGDIFSPVKEKGYFSGKEVYRVNTKPEKMKDSKFYQLQVTRIWRG